MQANFPRLVRLFKRIFSSRVIRIISISFRFSLSGKCGRMDCLLFLFSVQRGEYFTNLLSGGEASRCYRDKVKRFLCIQKHILQSPLWAKILPLIFLLFLSDFLVKKKGKLHFVFPPLFNSSNRWFLTNFRFGAFTFFLLEVFGFLHLLLFEIREADVPFGSIDL